MTPFGEPKSQFAACHLALFLIHVGGYDGMEQLEALEGCATVGVVPHQLREVCGGVWVCSLHLKEGKQQSDYVTNYLPYH